MGFLRKETDSGKDYKRRKWGTIPLVFDNLYDFPHPIKQQHAGDHLVGGLAKQRTMVRKSPAIFFKSGTPALGLAWGRWGIWGGLPPTAWVWWGKVSRPGLLWKEAADRGLARARLCLCRRCTTFAQTCIKFPTQHILQMCFAAWKVGFWYKW